MFRLEGQVNGRRIARTLFGIPEVLAVMCVLLDGLPGLRVIRVLRTLETAAMVGRTWTWSADEFSLTVYAV